MRNRSPAGSIGGTAAQSPRTIHSPIQGKKGKYGSGGLLRSKGFLVCNAIVLVGLILFLSGGLSSTTGTADNAAAASSSGVRRNAQENKGVKGGKRPEVRDADGDLVTDDMLAKDIAAGRNIDVKHEEIETDITGEETRWDKSKNIPDWMKDYFIWHNSVTKTLTEENWREQRYLVMTCLGGQVCGNVAHRLRPIMGMLRMAADSKRIFMMHWDKPDSLEDYLHPPQHGGINWVVPKFVMWKVRKSPIVNVVPAIHLQAFQDDRRIVNVMYNDDSFAEPYYNDQRKEGEVPASMAYKDVWNVLFKPSFMLTERLKETMDLMGLVAGEYAAVHIDYEYEPASDVEAEELRAKVHEAMNCLSGLRPGGPYFVAAQTYAIAQHALDYAKQHTGVNVQAKQIAHDTSTVPVDLYTSFVEIMLLASARCVAFNRGGYGQLGYMLGYDYNCRIKYTGEDVECKWVDPPPPAQEK